MTCGTGGITLPIARAGVEVTGPDITPSVLARSRQRADRQSTGWKRTAEALRPGVLGNQHDAAPVQPGIRGRVPHLGAKRAATRRGPGPGVCNPDVAKLCRLPRVAPPSQVGSGPGRVDRGRGEARRASDEQLRHRCPSAALHAGLPTRRRAHTNKVMPRHSRGEIRAQLPRGGRSVIPRRRCTTASDSAAAVSKRRCRTR
ncbi:hypothetical protein [Embleya sp. NPDC050493]|uniref:hypothetical protein n=1 Tax=Embleya sp. NPDC050493 TaxID=3363989 RepID=UPI0037B078CB